jgi:DNA-binding NarL/FixJ family response regulator
MTFTAREQQLIRLCVERGMCIKEAAWELHISEKTGQTHRANIMRKLRDTLGRSEFQPVTSVDLAFYALVNNLVDRDVIERRYTQTTIPSPS